MSKEHIDLSEWVISEFSGANFGDKRLTDRLIRMADSFIISPEKSINQACEDWSQSKAAYRFFQNDSVSTSKILDSHVAKTALRSKGFSTILAIQDTCYISYKDHKKTQGLGIITARINSKTTNFQAHGLVMHTTFAVTTDGLPVGLLDQKISSRPQITEEVKEIKKGRRSDFLPIEEKESIRWLESLKKSNQLKLNDVKVVTVCDREADMYDLFELASSTNALFLVRAAQDRAINKEYTYAKKSGERLWSLMNGLDSQGKIEVNIPARGKPARTAILEVRFGSFNESTKGTS